MIIKSSDSGQEGHILITEDIFAKLLENGKKSQEGDSDFVPVVKLFTPDAGATWLLTDVDPDEPDIAFGLCDLGLGYLELGTVRLSELAEIRGKLGLPVERDLYFTGEHPISVYADKARQSGTVQE